MLPISILLPEKYKHIFLNHEKWHFLEFCISCRYVLCLFCWHKECANVIRSNQWPYNLVWSIKTPCNKKDMESITFCMTANIKAMHSLATMALAENCIIHSLKWQPHACPQHAPTSAGFCMPSQKVPIIISIYRRL